MLTKKNALFITTYELTGSSPVDRRFEYLKNLLSDFEVELLSLAEVYKRKRGFRNRISRLLFHRGSFYYQDVFNKINEKLRQRSYDKIIVSVPDAEVLEYFYHNQSLCEITHLDIRDGIYFENLYSPLESLFLRNYLNKLEDIIPNFDLISSNVPHLKEYYDDKYRIDVSLYIPEYRQVNEVQYPIRSVVYAGGLLRSTIGLNALKFAIAVRGIENLHVAFIGRFYSFEKIIYRLLSADKIIFHDQVPHDQLLEFIKDFDAGLAISNCKRKLMPSKINTYNLASLPVIWIGPASTNNEYLSQKIKFTRIEDKVVDIKRIFIKE